MLLIKNATLHDGIRKRPRKTDILIKDGKIAEIAKGIKADCKVFDAAGRNVYPGFIDAHSHVGLHESGIGFEGTDVNEYNNVIYPELRAIDAIQPTDPYLQGAYKAGVTAVCAGPGSASVISGQFAVIKTKGVRVDDMIVLAPAAMKCAFGENVKKNYKEKGAGTRMGVAAKLRETLYKAREYDKKKRAFESDPENNKEPAFDFHMESMLPVIRGEIPLKAHAHRADDIFTAIRIAKEFGVKLTLEHVTEGHLVAAELAKEPYPMAVGPSMCGSGKYELRNKSFTTPGILAKAGCRVSITTDAPVTLEQYLPLCAALAIRDGMDPFDALQAITINPARHIGVENRLGSVEVGKDADLVVINGNFYDASVTPDAVFIDGKAAYMK